VRLPGRIPSGARLGTLLPRRVKGGFGRAEPVGRGVVGFLGMLAGGVASSSAASAAASLRRVSASCRIASRRSRAPSAT
jgi:hypothetical protein